MRTSIGLLVSGLLLSGALVAGCGQSSPAEPEGTGGAAGAGTGTGGSAGAGEGGSPAAVGGSAGSDTGGSAGSAVGSGGAAGDGSGGSSAGTGGSEGQADAAPPSGDGPAAVDPGPAGAFALCPKCKPMFDGKSFDGWVLSPAAAFEVKAGVFASTGKVAGGEAHAWTKDDYGEYRIFFTVRHVSGKHLPCTVMFGIRPPEGKAPARGMNGIQFQPPKGGSWDYRPGKGGEPYMSGRKEWMYPTPRPMFDTAKWHRCEILAHASKGSFRAACCEIEGRDSCKAVVSLEYADPTIGKKAPFAIMMHNEGLIDEYKDFWIETDPAVDDLLSTK